MQNDFQLDGRGHAPAAAQLLSQPGGGDARGRRSRARVLRAGGRARRPPRPRARAPRRRARRPGGDLRLEHPAPLRALPRGAVLRRRPAHAEHPPLPRADRLHRQPRARRRDLRRRLARRAAGQARAPSSRACATSWSWATATSTRCRAPSPTSSCSRRRARASFAWPEIDERAAAALCYTSGTTGNPKGVLYSHRSVSLHSTAICTADAVGLSSRDRVLAIVPMFHVNAWGLPFGAALTGAELLLPGAVPAGRAAGALRRGRARDAAGRRADRARGAAGPRRRARRRPQLAARRDLRRLRGAAQAHGGLRAPRRAHPAGVGDDRDEPDRHRGPAPGGRGRGRGALGLPHDARAGWCRGPRSA